MDTSQNTTPPINNRSANNINTQTAITRKKLPFPVYYIESPNDSTVLIGLDVTVEIRHLNTNTIIFISWYDTSHERIMQATEIAQNGENFAFKRADSGNGSDYYLYPMSLEIYNQRVKQHLSTNEDFTNEKELIEAFYQH